MSADASPPRSDPSPRPVTPGLTQSQVVKNQHIQRAGKITDELIELYAELGLLEGLKLRTRWDTLQTQLVDKNNNITKAREMADESAGSYHVDIIKLRSEIDGHLLALQHCDRIIKYWLTMEGEPNG